MENKLYKVLKPIEHKPYVIIISWTAKISSFRKIFHKDEF
jgi:hypothetical protein